MHKFLEHYVQGTGYDDLTELGQKAKAMAQKIIDIGLTPVEEIYGSEVTLYYPGLYAGSTDLVCVHNGMDTVVDFKQANRPKREDWIEDYFMQIGAYAMAHDYVHNSEIKQGVVMICTPDLYYQEFKISGPELRSWKHKFLKRLDMYHELKFDEKEAVDIDLPQLEKEMKMNDRMFKALMKKYDAEIEDAVYRIDAINEHNLIIPEHTDILGEVDKMLQKISSAEDRLAALRRHYGEKKAKEVM